ncbi:MAG: hypothetical protein B7X04_00550 [Parcubacteria group bacterium 21-54-25]|nr:MAG: hypothetical protein B7X04_00550 [Parcubacteria group bacterium 21-54-25]HQU07456.1 glycosyltransferase [Candidatus Paceibacterota bacterium]
MKVLFISNDPTIFDPESPLRTRERMRAYADAIGELHIISRGSETKDETDGPLFLHSIKPLPTVLGRTLFLYTFGKRARKLVKELGIEVVSAQDPFEHGAAARRAVSGTNAKLHIQVHTDFLSPYFAKESRKNKARVRIADSVLPQATGVRVVSERIKKSLVERYGDRIPEPVVIPIAAAVPAPENAPPPKFSFKFSLLAVSRLEKEKCIGDLIRAVATLAKTHYPVGLYVVGAGRDRAALSTLASTLGISERVIFLGEQPNVAALFARAQVFVQASSYEGYGRTYIEAALVGVPMVVTDTGIIGEVFKNGESALVCPVGDVACLTHAIATLIEENAERVRIGGNARRAAEMHLSTMGNVPERIAADLAQLIARV